MRTVALVEGVREGGSAVVRVYAIIQEFLIDIILFVLLVLVILLVVVVVFGVHVIHVGYYLVRFRTYQFLLWLFLDEVSVVSGGRWRLWIEVREGCGGRRIIKLADVDLLIGHELLRLGVVVRLRYPCFHQLDLLEDFHFHVWGLVQRALRPHIRRLWCLLLMHLLARQIDECRLREVRHHDVVLLVVLVVV